MLYDLVRVSVVVRMRVRDFGDREKTAWLVLREKGGRQRPCPLITSCETTSEGTSTLRVSRGASTPSPPSSSRRPGPRPNSRADLWIARRCSASSSAAAAQSISRARSATILFAPPASRSIRRTAATSRAPPAWQGMPTCARHSSTIAIAQSSGASTSRGCGCERRRPDVAFRIDRVTWDPYPPLPRGALRDLLGISRALYRATLLENPRDVGRLQALEAIGKTLRVVFEGLRRTPERSATSTLGLRPSAPRRRSDNSSETRCRSLP
jgi:hypothetical protein